MHSLQPAARCLWPAMHCLLAHTCQAGHLLLLDQRDLRHKNNDQRTDGCGMTWAGKPNWRRAPASSHLPSNNLPTHASLTSPEYLCWPTLVLANACADLAGCRTPVGVLIQQIDCPLVRVVACHDCKGQCPPSLGLWGKRWISGGGGLAGCLVHGRQRQRSDGSDGHGRTELMCSGQGRQPTHGPP